MKFERELSLKNLKKKPGRTAALMLLAAFLAFAVFLGSAVVVSLRQGLNSYEARLGADIVVVPNSAKSKGTLDAILLQGIPGYFYMDAANLEKLRQIEGVEAAAPQFFLASSSAGCCSVPVQIIGFDPETDFSIRPWIRENYSGSVGDGDLIVGNDIAVPSSRSLTFYDTECTVVAKLDKTGTGLDSAIYANMNTIKTMMNNAKKLGFHYFDDVNADGVVSSVMLRVADGFDVEAVTDDINIHLRRVTATPSRSMISSIAAGLSGVSRVIGLLMLLLWALSTAILVVSFVMIANERKKEFAILRVAGASERMLKKILAAETALISVVGALAGALAGAFAVIMFGGFIKTSLDLPYLAPSVPKLALIALGAVLTSALAGMLTAWLAAKRISANETGLILREGA